jgi:hypothetical protein
MSVLKHACGYKLTNDASQFLSLEFQWPFMGEKSKTAALSAQAGSKART